MDVSEFIDTYSDDLIYLHEARRALLTHPLSEHYAFSDHSDASFCRITAVFVVGAIEAMLADWREQRRDETKILDRYFEQGVKNGDRVRNLYQAFRDAGIEADEQIFDDYLAIKYLRNTIIHGRWHEHEKEWLDRRDFPADARKLTTDHLHKMDHVVQNMMFYIFLTGHVRPIASAATASVTPSSNTKPQKLVRLDEAATKRIDDPGILKLRDMERIIWSNLERMNSMLYHAVEETVTHAPYEWTGRRELHEIEALGHTERKRLFYLAARRAGEDNYERLARHREMAREALGFWREYWARAVAGRGLDEAKIERATVELAQGSGGSGLVEALQVGKRVYEVVPNIMPVTLLTLYLPITDPENSEEYLLESDRARGALRLNRAWYARVERNRGPQDEGLDFYDDMREEFRRLASGRGSA
jgi:hypothetical protein